MDKSELFDFIAELRAAGVVEYDGPVPGMNIAVTIKIDLYTYTHRETLRNALQVQEPGPGSTC